MLTLADVRGGQCLTLDQLRLEGSGRLWSVMDAFNTLFTEPSLD